MNLQTSLWGKVLMSSLFCLVLCFSLVSCDKEQVDPADDPLIVKADDQEVLMVSQVNDLPVHLEEAGRLPNGDIVYQFPNGKGEFEFDKSMGCTLRSCVKVKEGSVVYIQGNNPFTGPYVIGPFCGPIKTCVTLPNFPVPQMITSTYVGTTGATLTADLYPTGSLPTAPPDVTVVYPANSTLPPPLADIFTTDINLSTSCNATIVDDM